MPLPAYLARRIVARAAVLAAILTPAPAAAGYIVTFTGTFDYSEYSSSRWDGANGFEDDLPPLFDLARLEGGSFSAKYLIPDVPPVDVDSGVAQYEYDPPTPLAVALLDPAGAVVHRIEGGLRDVDVENSLRPNRPGRPPLRVNDVSFLADPSGFGGIDAPPELYGPNEFVSPSLAAYFEDGTRPLGDLSIPTDGATYLDFDSRVFSLNLAVFNGDPAGDGPNLYVYTLLEYQITGASVAPVAVPEPASLALLGTGAVVLIGHVGRRKAEASTARA